jgi:hypothetical protein
MVQNQQQLLSQKHTGFEDFAFHFNIISLPSSADFFFVSSVASPDSETNEILSTKSFPFFRSVNHRPFLYNNPSEHE